MTDKHIYLDKEGLKHVVDHLEASVTAETRRATGAEENLQEQIETIHTAQNCVDIVATYSELLELDTSILHDNDKVEVLADETHEGNVYIYRLSKQEGEEPEWTAVGSMISVGDSWKQWSKDNGSSAIDDTSIHIGANTEINGSHDVAIGNSNTVGETSDNTVILGNANSVEYDADTEHSSQTATAVIGDKNIVSGTRYTGEDMTYFSGAFGTENNVSGEGVAIGKNNTVTEFGTSIGQNNDSSSGSMSIGRGVQSEGGSMVLGIVDGDGKLDVLDPETGEVSGQEYRIKAEGGSMVLGVPPNKQSQFKVRARGGSVVIAVPLLSNPGSDSVAEGGSLLIGTGTSSNQGSVGIGGHNYAQGGSLCLGNGNSALFGACSIGFSNSAYGQAMSFGYNNISGRLNSTSGSGEAGKSIAIGFANTSYDNSIAFGDTNTNLNRTSLGVGISNKNIYGASGAFGVANYGAADSSWIFGRANHDVYGGSVALGWDNVSITNGSTAVGYSNSYVTNASFVLGSLNKAGGYSVVLGHGNSSYVTSHAHGLVIGNYNDVFNNNPEIASSSCSRSIDLAPHSEVYEIYIKDWNRQAFSLIGRTVLNLTKLTSAPDFSNFPDNSYYIENSVVYVKYTAYSGAPAVLVNGQYNALYYAGNYYYREIPGANDDTVTEVFIPLYLSSAESIDDVTSGSNKYYLDTESKKVTLANTLQTLATYNTSGTIFTSSFVAGSNNTVYGHNGIAVGFMNMAGDSVHWNEPYYNPSESGSYSHSGEFNYGNDGFETAIGRECRAYRNYDLAYGFRSVANGGENVAIQNSSANGYRNVALVSSSVPCGILNFAGMESTMVTNVPASAQGIVSKNFLVNAKAKYTQLGDNFADGGMNGNIVMNTNVAMSTQTRGTARNTIIGGGDSKSEPLLANIACDSINDNLMLYVKNTNVRTDESFVNNVFIGTSLIISLGNTVFHDNLAIGACDSTNRNGIILTRTNSSKNIRVVRNNAMLYGSITGEDASTVSLEHNLVAMDSLLNVTNDGSPAVNFNTVLCGSTLVANNGSRYWGTESNNPSSYNFLYGMTGLKIHGCFGFSDNKYSQAWDSYAMDSCLRSFNFGDNTLICNAYTNVFGGDNTLVNTERAFVCGTSNSISSALSESDRNISNASSDTFIFGSQNSITQTKLTGDANKWSRNYLFGSNNILDGYSIGESCIIGSGNKITRAHSTSYVSEHDVYGSNLYTQGDVLMATEDIRLKTSEDWYKVTVRSGNYYLYVGGGIKRYTGVPSSYTNISGDSFVAGVRSESLTSLTYYFVNTEPTQEGGSYPELSGLYTIYSGSAMVYCGNNKIMPAIDQCGTYGTTIVGDNNTVTEFVQHSTVIGTYNELHDDLLYSIGGMFVQGDHNKASDGSNIVCMGNGNVTTGHNSVAIGAQLVSNKCQTVIGKYNEEIAGPDRLTDGSEETDKALFIVGNGYGEKDDEDYWQDESYIHRSNAMVVYADGTVEAKRFVATDEPELALVAGAGLTKEDDFTAGTSTISLDSELAKLLTVMKSRPKQAGKTYMLQSSGEDGELAWVEVGMVDAE